MSPLLPSCAYCGTDNTSTLIQCKLAAPDEGDIWFCNGIGSKFQGSHIIQHLIRVNKNNTINEICHLHECRSSQFSSRMVQCSKCRLSNVFDLGISRSSPSSKWTFLCRRAECSAQERQSENWRPIVDSNNWTFVAEIASPTSLKETAFDVALTRVCEVERALRPNEIVDEVEMRRLEAELPDSNPLRYADCQQYITSQVALNDLERKGAEGAKRRRREPAENNIDLILLRVSYDRKHVALTTFGSRPMDFIKKAILATEEDLKLDVLSCPPSATRFSVPNLPKLNDSQFEAVCYAMRRAFSVIEAPPGTGKTVVGAVLAYHFAKSRRPVLLCAPSNIAADRVTSTLLQTGLEGVVRLYARSREEDPDYHAADAKVDEVALHRLAPCSTRRKRPSLKQLDILRKASVICCTCIASYDKRLAGFGFETVIIDECTQAIEAECLVPITKCTKQVVLIGDRKQLGPIVNSKKAKKANFGLSLFERMGKVHGSTALKVQYRMHPAISKFPNAQFYEGALTDGVKVEDRSMFPPGTETHIWPDLAKPVVFISTSILGGPQAEEISGTATSYLNPRECQGVAKTAQRLFAMGVQPSQIGVICMYEGQREHLFEYLSSIAVDKYSDDRFKQIEVKTVDGFQGRENDFIIVSCVRSNAKGAVGFLADERRINVALTRAKYGLVIYGDATTLEKSPIWKGLIDQYKADKTLVENYYDDES